MRIPGRRLAIAGVLTSLLLLVPSGTAGAQVYPPDGCQISISRSVVAPGDTVIVTGVDFLPGENVDLFLLSDPVFLATVVADSTGSFSTEVTIPLGTTPGLHQIRANSGTCTLTADVTVTAPGGPGGGGQLAFTGGNSLPLLWIALVLLALGTAFVVGARRRAQVRQRDAS